MVDPGVSLGADNSIHTLEVNEIVGRELSDLARFSVAEQTIDHGDDDVRVNLIGAGEAHSQHDEDEGEVAGSRAGIKGVLIFLRSLLCK